MREISSNITYKDKEYKLVFNLNVMEKIQDEYGTLDKWGELTDGKAGEVNIKALVFGIMEMINEGIDITNEETGEKIPFMTHKAVARMLTDIGVESATAKVNDLVIDSTKNEKNA